LSPAAVNLAGVPAANAPTSIAPVPDRSSGLTAGRRLKISAGIVSDVVPGSARHWKEADAPALLLVADPMTNTRRSAAPDQVTVSSLDRVTSRLSAAPTHVGGAPAVR
jgi:hypothetical protein